MRTIDLQDGRTPLVLLFGDMTAGATRLERCMMRLLHKLGAGIMTVGLFLILVGGMSIKRGPDGTWIQVNLVHGVGGGLLLCGVAFTYISAFAYNASSAEPAARPDRGGKA